MLMRKIIVFMVWLCACVSFTGCSCFDRPANADRIGSGYVQSDKGLLFVEINDVRYSLSRVYANSSSRDGKNKMPAVDGMVVTAFILGYEPKVEFIAGDLTEEYLEEYFSTNATMAFIFLIFAISCVVMIILEVALKKVRVVHAD